MRSSARTRVVALSAILLALAGGLVLQQALRAATIRTQLSTEARALARKVAVGRTAEKSLPQLREEVRGIELELNRLVTVVPSSVDHTRDLEVLRGYASSRGLSLVETDAAEVRKDFYAEQQITAVVRGKEGAIQGFLDGLGGPGRLVDVDVLGRRSGLAFARFTLFGFTGATPEAAEAGPGAMPAPAERVWLPPFRKSVEEERERLGPLRTECERLAAILAEVADFERKKALLQHRAELVTHLQEAARRRAAAEPRVASPTRAQALAAQGDWELDAGDLVGAAASYAAAAETGEPFVSRRGILFEGRLYRQDAPRSRRLSSTKTSFCGLLAVDPASGRTVERHVLPGSPKAFRLIPGALEITYQPADVSGRSWLRPFPPPPDAVIVLGRGGLRGPVFQGPGLTRIQTARAAWGPALGFSMGTKPPYEYEPDARLSPERNAFAGEPRTLADLEAALRAQMDRDPTNPWLRFFLAHALLAQRKDAEAEAAVDDLFSSPPAWTPYRDFAWMASLSLRAGKEAWAERAWLEARERRLRLPQPVLLCSFLERLVDSPFLRPAAQKSRRGLDLDTQYRWLVRARELTGPCVDEPDWEAFAALAWAKYWREKGDMALAGRELAYARAVESGPMSFRAAAARVDHALALLLGTSFALVTVAAVLLTGAVRRWATGGGPRRALSGVSAVERRVLAAAFLAASAGLFLVSLATLGMTLRFEKVPPAGYADALGHAGMLRALEDALEEDPGSTALRFTTATAFHLAGAHDRARELYGALPAHEHARRNLDALERGAPPVEMPSAGDLADGFLRVTPMAAARLLWEPVFPRFKTWGPAGELLSSSKPLPAAPYRVLLVLALLLTLAFLAVQPDREAPEPSRSRVARALPGLSGLTGARPWLGYVTLLLVATPLFALGLRLIAKSPLAPGPVSAVHAGGLPFGVFPFPTPPGLSSNVEVAAYHGLFWMYPYAKLFWPAMAALFCLGIALHVRYRRRPDGPGGTPGGTYPAPGGRPEGAPSQPNPASSVGDNRQRRIEQAGGLGGFASPCPASRRPRSSRTPSLTKSQAGTR